MALKRYLWYYNPALTTLKRVGTLMMEFIIANMPILQNLKTLRPPHGLEEAHVVHLLVPDQFQDMPHPSQPKFDLSRPPREGFRSIKGLGGDREQKLSLYFYCYTDERSPYMRAPVYILVL